MNPELIEFISAARARGLKDTEIKKMLVGHGWSVELITPALHDGGAADMAVPQPPGHAAAVSHAMNPAQNTTGQVPGSSFSQALAYKIFAATLALSLLAIILLANFTFSSPSNWSGNALPLTMLIVGGLVAVPLGRYLRRMERTRPGLRQDAARRQAIQAVQLLAFLAVIGHTIVLLYFIISGHYGAAVSGYDQYNGSPASHPSFWHDLIRWLYTVVVAGGAFMYYLWDGRRRA